MEASGIFFLDVKCNFLKFKSSGSDQHLSTVKLFFIICLASFYRLYCINYNCIATGGKKTTASLASF